MPPHKSRKKRTRKSQQTDSRQHQLWNQEKTKLNQWKNTAEVTHWVTNIRHKQEFLPIHYRNFTLQSYLIRQELYNNQWWQRHRHNYALPQIAFIWQRDRLDQEKSQQHVLHDHGQLQRGRSLWVYRTFLLESLSEKYGKNNVGLYRDDGLVLLKKRKRTTIGTDYKGHHSRIQETRTEHFYKRKPKNLQLPRRHSKLNGRILLSI